jgi:hypothetical protein
MCGSTGALNVSCATSPEGRRRELRMASELIPDAAGFVRLTLVASVGIWWLQSQRKADQGANTSFVALPNSVRNKSRTPRRRQSVSPQPMIPREWRPNCNEFPRWVAPPSLAPPSIAELPIAYLPGQHCARSNEKHGPVLALRRVGGEGERTRGGQMRRDRDAEGSRRNARL